MQTKQARDQQKQIEKEKILLQQMEIEKQIEERQVQIADRQRELEKKVQAKLAVLPADEFEKIKNWARLEARRQVPPPKGLNADLMALAKKTLASLPGTERDRIRREAEISVRKILGNTISDDNVGFVHALENKMVGIVRDNFSLTSPLSEEFERRISEKTDLLISKILLREHNSLGSKTHGHSVW